jgi:hypothetical protein
MNGEHGGMHNMLESIYNQVLPVMESRIHRYKMVARELVVKLRINLVGGVSSSSVGKIRRCRKCR